MLVATFTLVAAINTYGYSLLANGARDMIRKPRILKIVTRTGASALVMAGFATMLARRV